MEPALVSTLLSPIFVRLRLVSSWEDPNSPAPLWEDLCTLWTYGRICRDSRSFLLGVPEFQALRLAMWEYKLVAEPGWVSKVDFVRDRWALNFAAFTSAEAVTEELANMKVEHLAQVRDRIQQRKREL